jgi:hypothetical protein
MKKRLPVWVGVLAAGIPAVWFSVVPVEQVPTFIRDSIHGLAVSIGMLLFQSREAALAIEYPLFLVCCIIFGLLVGFMCRFIMRRHTHDA